MYVLSDSPCTIPSMFHPWRRLRDHLPDWDVVHRALPDGILGLTDVPSRTIILDSRMLQSQRRACLAHELHHAEHGDCGAQDPSRERAIDTEVARDLVPLEHLLQAVRWARSLWELADECWVDVDTMRCRLDHLHPAERAAIRTVLAARDNEEGP